MNLGDLKADLGLPDEMTPAQVQEYAETVVRAFRKQGMLDGDHLADLALTQMIAASSEADTLKRQNLLRSAGICASLAHRDAVKELTAAARHLIGRQVDSNAELAARLREVA